MNQDRKNNLLLNALTHIDLVAASRTNKPGVVDKYAGSFGYIPSVLDQFIDDCYIAHKTLCGLRGLDHSLELEKIDNHIQPELSFLDIGSGVGTKVLLAAYFFSAYGIEINDEYSLEARRLFGFDKDQIITTDAMIHDYSSYDCLYFYCPFSDQKLEEKFESRLLFQAKKNSLIIGYGNCFSNTAKYLMKLYDIETIEGNIYVKT